MSNTFAKNASNISSSSSSSSSEARNGCLRLLHSSNSSSDASLSLSSSRKPKSLPKVANVSVKSFRSKENGIPKKPFSEKFKKKQQLGILKRENGESKINPMCKTAQKPKLSSGRRNPVKTLERKKLNSDSTPVGSSSVRGNAAECSDSREENGGSVTSVKTPPVEASVSPEIQSKMVVSNSAATPICYGTGHLLSGVADKRKCRRRGSLRGGCEKINLFDDEQSDQNVADDLHDCLIPLPGEASVRWLLSPCDEGREGHGSDLEMKLEECEMSRGKESVELDLLSSPSLVCGEVCSHNIDFRGNDSIDGAIEGKKVRTFMFSPQENIRFQCCLGNLDKNMCDSCLDASPTYISECTSVGLEEGNSVRGNSSSVSLGSFSSGNIIQTPDSDSSLHDSIRRLNVEANHRNSVSFELDLIKESLDAMSLSSISEMLILDSSSHSIVPIQVHNNVDSVCSWMSSCTSENLTLSQMRISWRDGLERIIDEKDELDCCPRLSDEEIVAVGCSDQQLKPDLLSQLVGGIENKYEHGDLCREDDVSPILLEYEPNISALPKEISPTRNTCAESICTNGDDLAVSCDSDWTNIEESHLFHVK